MVYPSLLSVLLEDCHAWIEVEEDFFKPGPCRTRAVLTSVVGISSELKLSRLGEKQLAESCKTGDNLEYLPGAFLSRTAVLQNSPVYTCGFYLQLGKVRQILKVPYFLTYDRQLSLENHCPRKWGVFIQQES